MPLDPKTLTYLKELFEYDHAKQAENSAALEPRSKEMAVSDAWKAAFDYAAAKIGTLIYEAERGLEPDSIPELVKEE